METGGLHEKAFETGKIDLGDQYNFLTGAFSPPTRKPHCVWFCRRTSFRLSGFTTSRSEGRTRFNQCWSSILGRGALIDLQVGIGLTTSPPNIRCSSQAPTALARGFGLDQLAEASRVRRQTPGFDSVADWRQRRHVCGSSR